RGADNITLIWDLRAADPGKNRRVLNTDRYPISVTSLAITPDSRWLITANDDGLEAAGRNPEAVRIWNLAAQDPRKNPRILRGNPANIMAISPDSRWLVTKSSDSIRLWDLLATDPNANPQELPGTMGQISSVAISPDSRWLVTGSWNTSNLGGRPETTPT